MREAIAGPVPAQTLAFCGSIPERNHEAEDSDGVRGEIAVR